MKLRIEPIIYALLICILPNFAISDRLVVSHKDVKVSDLDTRVIYVGDVPFISLNGLARAFKARTYFRRETTKLVVFFPSMQVKVAAGSSFLEFGSRMKQLPYSALFLDSEVYVPADAFMGLLKDLIFPALVYSIDRGSTRHIVADRFSTKSSIPFRERNGDRTPPTFSSQNINLTDIAYEEKENGLVVKFAATRSFRDSDFATFFKAGNWFYLTIYGGVCDTLKFSSVNPISTILKVEAIPQGNSLQLSFQFNREFTSSDIHYDARSNQILLSLFYPLNKDIKKKIEEAKTAWVIDTIVLDPGHGGKDSGTPGHWGYMHEKDIALDVALRLGRLLEQKKDLKVIYTRTTDKFIPLWRRPEIANKSGGKLFISLHVNSCETKSASGIEIYLLAPSESEDAIKVAEKENSVIQLEEEEDRRKYEGYDDIYNILANMVHSVNMKDSEKLAEIMSKNVSSKLSQRNRGVKQANFYVLVGASMPKILFEMGFNSNRSEAKKLNSKKYRQLVAETLYKSVVEFKEISDQSVVQRD